MNPGQRRADASGTDHRESSAGDREPVGRWLAPSVTADGTHLCRLRVSLTHAEEAAGLLFVVVAADRPGLEALMAHEDEKLARLTVPASRHRDSV